MFELSPNSFIIVALALVIQLVIQLVMQMVIVISYAKGNGNSNGKAIVLPFAQKNIISEYIRIHLNIRQTQ